MKTLKVLIVVTMMSLLVGCGGGSSSASAPTSIAGKTYRMVIKSGSGYLASTGTYTVSFSSSGPSYVIIGDGVNVPDSFGEYSYSSSGSQGIASAYDYILDTFASFSLNFTSSTKGNFLIHLSLDPNSQQSGSFTQI